MGGEARSGPAAPDMLAAQDERALRQYFEGARSC
jgi:hypothetical protein